jgi:two-component system copper resistance phosphate regulon response regulator CusR
MRLLVIEDDPGLVRALRQGLAARGFAVDVAETAAAVEPLLAEHGYDCLVLDLGLPDEDGMALLGRLRARGAAVPVLVLTARGGVTERVAGLDAGADDYLAKPFAFPELVARLHALHRRGTALAPALLRVGDLEVDAARFTVRRSGAPISVTAKEFAILEYLARHPGELVTRSMLLEQCWDRNYDGLSNLVDVYVSRLRRKLDAAGGPPLLHTVRGAGFVLDTEPR